MKGDRGRKATEDAESPSLVYVVGRVNQGIRRELRARLSTWDLSVPELTALSILARRPGLSNAQLARRSMVTPQTMIEILAGLEARGLVARRVDPGHGRVLRAELTPEGRRLVHVTEPAVADIEDEMLRGIDPEQRELVLSIMLTAMARLRAGLDSGTGPGSAHRPDAA